MARLGDTLQSLMALRAAKQLYPQLEIHFLAREKFAAAARRVPWIKSVITLPSEQLLGPVLNGKKSEVQAVADIARWIGPLVKDPWDFVVNWSYSEASSYLTGLLPARVKLGYTRRRDTTFSGADGWSHYIQGIVQGAIGQNIHLTDILTTQLLTALQIHVGDPANEGNSPVTSKGFFSLQLGEDELNALGHDLNRKWIGVQLGAAQDAKTWPTDRWTKFLNYVLDRNPDQGIVLLGGPEDEGRAKMILSHFEKLGHSRASSIVSLVGKSSFDLWASVVSRCQWVIAGDTAVIHLASVLGTRVLNLSIGPVRWSETGPYGNGHYVISSSLPCQGCADRDPLGTHTCRADVTPEALYATWSYAANEWAHRRQISIDSHFSRLGWSNHLTAIGIYRARIRGTQDGGGVVYEPLLQRPLRLDDWSSMVIGHIARSWYCGWTPGIGQELKREAIAPNLIKQLRELDEASDVLQKICTEAKATALNINRRGSNLKSDKVMNLRDRNDLRELGKKLMELDALVERMGKAHDGLRAFAQMSKVLMHHLRGQQLAELGKETADSYRHLSDGIVILRDWIKYTLSLAKPVVVSTGAPTVTPISKIGPQKEV